jgi:hypothetical protein
MADQCASHQAHCRQNRNGFCGAFREKQPHHAPTLRLYPARRIARNSRIKQHKKSAANRMLRPLSTNVQPTDTDRFALALSELACCY